LSHRGRAAIAAAAFVLVVPANASAATKVVDMGTPPDVAKPVAKQFTALGANVNAFFPATTTIHVGDSVRFQPAGFHNLDLPKKGGGPTPLLAPVPGQTIAGAVDAAGVPYWFNGQANIQFNLPALAPVGFGKKFTYNGSKGVQSGLPLAAKPKPVTVKFSKAGSYTYFCDVHPGMKARVRVRSKSRSVPSARAHAKLIGDQVSRALATAKKLAKVKPPAGTVDLGVAGKGGVELFVMNPGAITVPVGTTLNFRMSPGSYEVHTATFGPGDIEDPNSFIGKIATSFEGPAIDQSAIYRSQPPGTVGTLTPTLHGNGYWNSGALDATSATPLPAADKVTFGAPGTYTYYCLVHPFMKATVTVQ
jgi:plastocyanin